MKTAVIITGAMRSFDKCLPNLQWQVFRHFPDAKFYVVTEDDEDAHKARLLWANRPEPITTLRIVKQPPMEIPPGCPDTWTQGQPYMHEPYAISVHPHAVLGQLWMLREGWRLYQEANEPADLVIRCRPDLWFHSFKAPEERIVSSVEGSEEQLAGRFNTMVCEQHIAMTPCWGRFGGINDRFALLGAKAAPHYFTVYDKLPRLIKEGAPLHPETLVRTSLEDGGCYVDDSMHAIFSTLRKTGEFRPPEITAVDMLGR